MSLRAANPHKFQFFTGIARAQERRCLHPDVNAFPIVKRARGGHHHRIFIEPDICASGAIRALHLLVSHLQIESGAIHSDPIQGHAPTTMDVVTNLLSPTDKSHRAIDDPPQILIAQMSERDSV